jgi:hypothetical protein
MSSRTEGGLVGNDDELLRAVLVSSARGDGASPRTFAEALGTAAERKSWLALGFATFKAFLLAGRDDGGIGLTEDQLTHAAKLAGPETDALVTRVLREEVPAANRQGRPGKGSDTSFSRQHGNASAESILARLKRDDPGMARRVIGGELSPNAAARLKGWRKPSILISSPRQVVLALRRHMSQDDLAEVVRLLQGG